MAAGFTQAEAHVNGNCWLDTCSYCQQDPDPCEVCDGTGEVFNTATGQDEQCRTCLGTGKER